MIFKINQLISYVTTDMRSLIISVICNINITTNRLPCYLFVICCRSRSFPSMQQISEDLPSVLDRLGVKLCIGLAEGAGANILARFGMAAPDRCMGLILIHCTASTAGVMEHFKDKVSGKKRTRWAGNLAANSLLSAHGRERYSDS